jgi:hypothetical protein
MLMATSLVSGANALEINQQRAPSTDGAPAFTLPAFLDGARLPDMQDAWRAHFGDASDAAAVQPASEVTPRAPGAETAPLLDTAREAMTRAEQASREAAAVRARAEELSRRFGAGGAESAADMAAAAAVPPTETASINRDANAADAAQPAVEHVLAPADASAAPDTAAASPDDAPVIEDMATKPAKPVKRYSAPFPPRQAVQAAAQNAPPAKALLKVEPAAPKPEDDPMMPNELRAFGWNAQP